MKYKRKPCEVEAFQYFENVPFPNWLMKEVDNGNLYYVASKPFMTPDNLYLNGVRVWQSDYFLYDGNKVWCVSSKEFEEDYEIG